MEFFDMMIHMSATCEGNGGTRYTFVSSLNPYFILYPFSGCVGAFSSTMTLQPFNIKSHSSNFITIFIGIEAYLNSVDLRKQNLISGRS